MSAFGDAFKAARAAGKKTFTFNGKSYHTRTKEDEAKAKKPDVSKNKASPAEYERIKPVDKSPKEFGEDGKLKNVNPVDMPERRRLGPRTEAPDIMKTPGKADDTSLSVSERIKNARERARTSDTGTDKRSVNERFKEAAPRAANMLKSAVTAAGDVISPMAGMLRRTREAAEKEMGKGKGMKKGGTVKKGRDGLAQRGKTKGRMC